MIWFDLIVELTKIGCHNFNGVSVPFVIVEFSRHFDHTSLAIDGEIVETPLLYAIAKNEWEKKNDEVDQK